MSRYKSLKNNRLQGLIQLLVFIFCITSCNNIVTKEHKSTDPFLIILGTVQDGGSPHAGCKKVCCSQLFEHPKLDRKVVSIGLVDPETNQYWIIEATPDFPTQLKLIQNALGDLNDTLPAGIFLTHAHIGHYTGLMHLGKEVMGTTGVKVYAMPRMKEFLTNNGPWSQLVEQKNVVLDDLENKQSVKLSTNLSIVPITVPHRDEYSETVGYRIEGPNKSILFIPDINKWNIWENDILDEVESVDFAFLDATFYDENEIKSRDISQIPHPFVIETMRLFQNKPDTIKSRIHFIHLNHTNPLLDSSSKQYSIVKKAGFRIAQFGQTIQL